MQEFDRPQLSRLLRVGYAADPAIDMLLDKARLAQIKIRQLELGVRELEAQIELAQVEITQLQEQYDIKR